MRKFSYGRLDFRQLCKIRSNISIGINCSIGHGSKIFNNATLAGGVVLNIAKNR